MQKLITPIQYEPALDVLNQIKNIYISDKVALSIDAMQACKNPVGHGNPIIGKFCREDNHGALCSNSVDQGFDNYELGDYYFHGPPAGVTHVWAQKVFGVLVYTYMIAPRGQIMQWITQTGVSIKNLVDSTWEWLPYEGYETRIYCSDEWTRVFIELYGFY